MKTPFNEDDYFKGSTMSFGEHLEELRTCLINAIWGLMIGIVVGFLTAPTVVKFFKGPIEIALVQFYVDKAVKDLDVRFGKKPPVELLNLVKEREMVPEYLQIEPSEFLHNLQVAHPGQFDHVGFSPYTIQGEDFEQYHKRSFYFGIGESLYTTPTTAQLAGRLKREGESDQPSPGKRVWEMLDQDDRKLVIEIAGETEEKVTKSQRRLLAVALDRLLTKPELYQSEEFQKLEGAEASKSSIKDLREVLSKSKEPKPGDVRQLNKLLVASYFASEIRPPQLTLVDMPVWKPVRIRVQALNAQEAFMIWMKASFMTGLVLSSPWIFYQIWIFVSAGLYPHEKGYVFTFLPISFLLFGAGALLAIGFVFQPVLNFLFYFNGLLEIDPDPRIGEWLGFVLLLPLAFGLSFQLPLVMLLINRIGLVSVQAYLEHWRVAILVIAVSAMIITPGGDPYSMLLMMAPLVGLYFLGIGMCKWMPQGRNPFSEVYEP